MTVHSHEQPEGPQSEAEYPTPEEELAEAGDEPEVISDDIVVVDGGGLIDHDELPIMEGDLNPIELAEIDDLIGSDPDDDDDDDDDDEDDGDDFEIDDTDDEEA